MSETMNIRLMRYQPEKDKVPYFQEYQVPYHKSWSVLEALQYIKDELDQTISFRWSCRMAVCGSCGMMLNTTPKLACKSFLRDYYPKTLTIESLENFPVERDLVPQIEDFIEKLESVKPYIIQKEKKDEGLSLQSPRALEKFRHLSMCINCLLCYAACPEYKVKTDYTGPAALALLQRYAKDSRDEGLEPRLALASAETGAWGCTAAGTCSQVCPKHVDPAGAIQELKADLSMDYMLSFFRPKTKKEKSS